MDLHSGRAQDFDRDMTDKYLATSTLDSSASDPVLSIWDIWQLLKGAANHEDAQPSSAVDSYSKQSGCGYNNVRWSPHNFCLLAAQTTDGLSNVEHVWRKMDHRDGLGQAD